MEHNATLRSDLQKEGINILPRFDVNPSWVSVPQNYSALDAAGNNSVIAFSHVAFNQEMYDFIRDNKYYQRSTLNQLIDPALALKPIADPPLKGVSLKFSWWPVSPTGFTPVPVWDFNPRFPGDAKNPPDTWPRVVIVDPIGGQTPLSSVTLNGYSHANPPVVSLKQFYSVQISTEEAALANADFRINIAAKEVLGRPLQAGDYLVMTAMHIATREFDPWVFTTFWWSDMPDAGPLASGRPDTITGVWRNYVMDISYNINNPKTDQGQPPVAYNPWLELFQLGGTRSQCMACHARAAFGSGVIASFNPTSMATSDANGFNASPNGASDPNFQPGTLSLHRIWTIFTRAQ